MIRSMTAFARREERRDGATLAWEIRSVNHRYLEPGLRLPDNLREIEPAVREALRARVSRGKVECTLRVEGSALAAAPVQIDDAQLARVLAAIDTVCQRTQVPVQLDPVEVLRWPGVTLVAAQDAEALAGAALALLEATLDDFVAAREREGAALAALIEQRLVAIGEEVARVRKALPQILETQRNRLRERVAEVTASVDSERLEQELVLLAQRMDVAEEMDRLGTHIGEVRRALKGGGNVGRRLDFLMQELNREANTLSSKSVSADTTQAAVEVKVLIEQIREQVQNIE
jgi:uncharacterized protein (TIGR00255 family)